jgi:DtxR family Mn-dependent transcriptional regulator
MLAIAKKQRGPVRLGESAEDYLEAVLVLSRQQQPVRVRDIALAMAVTQPSVVTALAQLERRGLVEHERYGAVVLTEAGAAEAEAVYCRHQLLHRFLNEVLGVSKAVAERDACRLEHALSPETVRQLTRFVGRHRPGRGR